MLTIMKADNSINEGFRFKTTSSSTTNGSSSYSVIEPLRITFYPNKVLNVITGAPQSHSFSSTNSSTSNSGSVILLPTSGKPAKLAFLGPSFNVIKLSLDSELHEYPIPWLFIILPVDSTKWGSRNALGGGSAFIAFVSVGSILQGQARAVKTKCNAKYDGYEARNRPVRNLDVATLLRGSDEDREVGGLYRITTEESITKKLLSISTRYEILIRVMGPSKMKMIHIFLFPDLTKLSSLPSHFHKLLFEMRLGLIEAGGLSVLVNSPKPNIALIILDFEGNYKGDKGVLALAGVL
ncbi:hypothetical protein BCR41DRAFT_402456 [Lobosporangium transversale]|uniref:Uncharacterized protein n=1 Tax=Lobosporangium transversale TaxID=64571 RepID=A0A1Y2G7M1_9FUNG|nr:hypothetical protein BCR41DRAFT_402456 [Lobosporangium transversale]ORY94283.1 hypothetical protein BCR41DRAFT_402456 [Lobosporangium transversale]|eukprot:XP_021875226.1 hypothetical protein BCR41DRAFT_402456 [Lobosporangium transversale]